MQHGIDYFSVLVGIFVGGLSALAWRFLVRGPREPEVTIEPTSVCSSRMTEPGSGRVLSCQRYAPHEGAPHRMWVGDKGWIIWTLLLALLAAPALADDHNEPPVEPFDGPAAECADLQGRYIKCPDAKPSPSPAPPPVAERVADPAPVPEPTPKPFLATEDPPAPEPDLTRPATVQFAAGGLASLGGGAEGVAVEPGINLAFDGPLFVDKKGMATRLEVDARLGVLQGATVEGLDQSTAFRSVAVAGRLCQPLSARLYFLPCVEAGFATRLEGDQHPRFRSPRWLSFQIKAVNERGDYLSVGVGPDQRLDDGDGSSRDEPWYRPAVQVGGSVKLGAINNNSKVHLRLVLQAILFLRTGGPVRDAPADRVTLGILVAR